MRERVPDDLLSSLDALEREGLDWVAFVEARSGDAPSGCSEGPGHGLLLLLSLGKTFGERTRFDDAASAHPFDERATRLAQGFLLAHFASPYRLLYPGDASLDLGAWLERGRVHFPSQLGLGIRPDCGTWFAVRAAAWVRIDAVQLRAIEGRYPKLSGQSPCATCSSKPCMVACPVDALRKRETLIELCVEQRAQRDSVCAERCHARLACPVGSEHRYGDAQLAYHYRRSLRVIAEWRARRAAPA